MTDQRSPEAEPTARNHTEQHALDLAALLSDAMLGSGYGAHAWQTCEAIAARLLEAGVRPPVTRWSHIEWVRDYKLDSGLGLVVNGRPLGFHVDSQPLMVEPHPAAPEHVHILWVPLQADGLAPTAGPPSGEPLHLEPGERQS